jgi:hypothetical protein
MFESVMDMWASRKSFAADLGSRCVAGKLIHGIRE